MGRPAIMTDGPEQLPEHELLARVFRALGDATRLRLLDVLSEGGGATQSELMARVGATQSRTSEHLTCLRWCGLVEARREGRAIRYAISDTHGPEMLRLARSFMAGNPLAVGGSRASDAVVQEREAAE